MRVRDLPLRILEARPDAPVLSVDGAWDAPGLNLSHWPGNRTPAELRHALSTGIALNFARLSEARQAELARGCTALANNHYDTDGVLALFVLARPDEALPRAEALLEAAAAGDLFRFPGERAFALDRTITALAEPGSPWEELWRGASGAAKHELLVRALLERLPQLLDDGLEEFAALWKPALGRLRADIAALAACAKDDLAHLELAVWTGERAASAGRHALFGTSPRDRALVLERGASGTRCRLVIDTSSWFEFQEPTPPPRPDLAALAARLNALEGTRETDAAAWRAQPTDSPAPELWFGGVGLEFFAEHNQLLGESRLDPRTIKREVVEAVRAAWVFPDAD